MILVYVSLLFWDLSFVREGFALFSAIILSGKRAITHAYGLMN